MKTAYRKFLTLIFALVTTACSSNMDYQQQKQEEEIAKFHQQYASDQVCDGVSVKDYNRDIYLEIDRQNLRLSKAFAELYPLLDRTDPLFVDKYLKNLESHESPVILNAVIKQYAAEDAYKTSIESKDCVLIKKNAETLKQSIIARGNARVQKIEHDTRMAKGIAVPPESCSFVGNYQNQKFTICYENYQLSSQDFVTNCKVSASISRANPESIEYGTKCPTAAVGACANRSSMGVIEYKYDTSSKESTLKTNCEYFGGTWRPLP